ncbi:alpha-tocopherol transfer protein-like isoform X1 [Lycorma delicatula]|uniref:alpha-tocopherol transfer protein-like isoform X1 n=1 Tax=Lycorma delicatula TaxID=130591 RepID=UPI003F5147AB
MYLETMTEERIINTLKENGMTAVELKSIILILKEWLQQQHHLPQYMSEQELQYFLWGSKCSLEKSKQKLDAYFTMRYLIPEFFSNRDPCTEKMVLHRRTVHLFPLPRLTADGYRVFYSGLHPSASNFCHLTHCRSLVNLTDYCVSNDSITNGTYIIIDGKNITFKLLKQFPTSQFLKASSYVTEVLPLRLKGIFFINTPSVFDYITAIFFPFLSQKIRERIHQFTDHTELYKFIDKKILPQEFGGEEASIEELNDVWQKNIESFKEWLMNEGSLQPDESKRPEKSKSKYSDLFGVEGSFRKIQID